ncbi:MAG: gamma carbonic anhydrase family protein [Ignavibacteriae bacterium]|nr:gamma carbonic anhydrase family protein [Ignavibacteriota bacterium]
MIHSFKGITPKIHPSVFLVESAEIIGDVEIGKESSVWFNAVIRGDVNYIRIGENTNIQDGCILHVRHETYPLILGSHITVGHGAILHACTIQDTCLIGMGAIVMDNALVESYSLIAAGTVVMENMKVPSGVLVAGVPGKIVRRLRDDERKMIEDSASNYKEYVKQYRQQT